MTLIIKLVMLMIIMTLLKIELIVLIVLDTENGIANNNNNRSIKEDTDNKSNEKVLIHYL